MEEPIKKIRNARRRTLIKAVVLLVLAGISIGLVEFSCIKAHLKPEQLQRLISEAGMMGPALLMISCSVGTCLLIPLMIFVGIGAALFGPFWGFAWVWPGLVAGFFDLLSDCPNAGEGLSFFTFRRQVEKI